jgi:hypothetical protein
VKTIDPVIIAKIKRLLQLDMVENPSDVRLLRWALAHLDEATPATVTWFEAVIARGGRKHPGPTPA